MRRSGVRLILPFILATFALAGCGGDSARDDSADGGGDSTVETTWDGSIEVLPGGPVRFPVGDGPPPFDVDAPPSGVDSPSVAVDAPAARDDSPRAASCDPNYDPCVPIDSDVDCAGGGGNGPSYVRGPVRVIGSDDPYRLDRDGDGVGCES
ncbi:MAG TPA: hypothetical protein VEX86_00955 [Longimicrobium sp.]|nr:hypothetical protein [Longimicrobium sp.]